MLWPLPRKRIVIFAGFTCKTKISIDHFIYFFSLKNQSIQFVPDVHCIKSKLYLAKWKWILRSGPKLKMLVKFHRSNGSFPNPLNWWRIRFGWTALDQCYWNNENWFAIVAPSLICNWRNTFTTDTLRTCPAWPPPPPPPTQKIQFCAYREFRPHVTRLLNCTSDHWTTPTLMDEVRGRD